MSVSQETSKSTSEHSAHRKSTGRQVLVLAALLVASFVVAGLGGLASTSNVDGWYSTASKAPWTPPNWVFGPVWTLLYTLMALAAWLVWRKGGAASKSFLKLYWVQLVLNLAWTPLFFALYPMFGTPALWVGFVDITALAVVLVFLIRKAFPISRLAFALLVPYIAWVAYAATLNLWAAINN
ncbi:TspO/MBR family protein [Pseudarthrobacter sp. PS3-L1]|uniref:TspO/MBR family protein n=1 Tax=Pseudarthrobacter sp. PS3-L1 TaxID=3046207 RepID=UPI0024B8EDBC|nr:TspO/MBR family protein [Pseudarthrobacter sp. PS3-L1]MDJ0319361.1 TspO/MBR family protein [Pseudarthrobacter sp. PS3-L1]